MVLNCHASGTGDLTLGPVGIGVGQNGRDLVDADVVLVDRIGIQLYAHRGKRAPTYLNLADSDDLGNSCARIDDATSYMAGLRGGFGGEGQNQDRRV